eukprot:scaffold55459_cov60-Phaeocystis_antarctica.AAC.2
MPGRPRVSTRRLHLLRGLLREDHISPLLLLCAASGEYGRYGGDRSGDSREAAGAVPGALRRAEAAPFGAGDEAMLEVLSPELLSRRPPPLAVRPKLDARRSSLRRLTEASRASCAASSVTSSAGRPEPPPRSITSREVPDSRFASRSRRSSRSRRLSCSAAASTEPVTRAGDEIALPTPPGRPRSSREFSSGARPIVGDRPGDWA